LAAIKGYGTVRYHVYDNVTLRNIQGAEVKAGDLTGTTDAQGIATFTNYPLGPQLSVTVTHPEYNTKTVGVIVNTDGAMIEVTLNPRTGAPPPTVKYSLRIEASSGGSTTPAPGTYAYDVNTTVTVTAAPQTGYELVRWEKNGVVQPATSMIAVIMDRDYVLRAVYELGAPPPPPPIPEKASLEVTVLERDSGKPLNSATVTLDSLTAYSDAAGIARISPIDPGDRSYSVSLSGYDTQTGTWTFLPGQVRKETVTLPKSAIFDPWGALTGALRGIWDLFLGALTGFAQRITAPLPGQASKMLSDARLAMLPGSPDKEVEENAKKLAEATRRRAEELVRKMYQSSPTLDLAPGAAQEILTVLLGAQVTIEAAATISDNIQPLRSVRILEMAQRINDALGYPSTIAEVSSAPLRFGLFPQLAYYWNKQFTPLIPGLQDLIIMLVREVITPEQYVEYAAMQGEAKAWADRRWEAHWRLPSPDYVRDAFHRGVIKADERDKFIVWHDYRPGARPGISKSDLEIMAALQKELIPRVDLRRGWELGLIDDDGLIERYRWLGYEDDAELMAEIQKAAALEGERAAVARAAGRLFRDKKMTEQQFRDLLQTLYIIGDRTELWVVRYKLEARAKPTKTEEAVEEGFTPASEE